MIRFKEPLPIRRLSPSAKAPEVNQIVTLKPKSSEPETLPAHMQRTFQIKPRMLPQPLPPLPAKRTYVASRTAGAPFRLDAQNLVTGNQIEIELPLGIGRYVSAKALRRLLGARFGETLMQRTATTWTICPDDMQIDLHDKRIQFRLNSLAFLS